jgi:YhcN/YlaJ family sporulation lipoprotein
MNKQSNGKMGYWLICAILLLLAAGCMNNQGGTRGGQTGQQGAQTGMNQQRLQTQNQEQQGKQGQFGTQGNMDKRIQIADQAVEKVVGIEGVQQANILVTQSNAYVAAVLEHDNQALSQDMEAQIAKQVRSTDANIQRVFVSTNPDFISRINSYTLSVQQGRPIAGFFGELNEMAQRLFPMAR